MIEKINEQYLDCMSKKIKVIDYCDKVIEKAKPLATVSINKETIDCTIASKVVFKYECDSKTDTYCDDKDIGCFMVKEDFALRLELTHSSILKVGQKRHLNCYFLSAKSLKGK